MTENLNDIINQVNTETVVTPTTSPIVKPNPCPYVMAALPSYRQHLDGLYLNTQIMLVLMQLEVFKELM